MPPTHRHTPPAPLGGSPFHCRFAALDSFEHVDLPLAHRTEHPAAQATGLGEDPRRARIVAARASGRRGAWLLPALAGLLLVAAGTLATRSAHAASAGSWLLSDGLAVGAAVGKSDYGTAVKGSVGSAGTGLKLPGVPGIWRWEGQAQSYGSETYTQNANSFKRSAWSLGVSVMPQLPVAPALAAYGKLGLHYLSSRASGPGLSESHAGFKPGLGAGLRWQVTSTVALKAEYENIGSHGGDVFAAGVEFPL